MKASCALSSSLSVLLTLAAPATQAQGLPALPVSPAPVVNYQYDAMGNRTKVIQAPGGLNLSSSARYDSLYRLIEATDARSGVTRLGHDGADRLTRVTDPRALVTQYAYNGLGDGRQVISPDTGTDSYIHDEAGNVKTRTTSRGVLLTYTHDAMNRRTGVAYSKSGQASEAHAWTYDQTGAGFAHGIGRLTSTSHPTGSTQYMYDAQGRVTSDTQRINAATGANAAQVIRTVGYTYDAAGNVTSVLYPSGRRLSIGYTAGRASSIGLAKDSGSTPAGLISGIQWEPFGVARAWNWQMSSGTKAQSWSYDTSGRLVRYRLADLIRDLNFDAAGRITGYKHYDANTGGAKSAYNQSFGYDELGRLTAIAAGTSNWSIGYDANGNRTSVTLNGTTGSYTTAGNSNRLLSTTNPTRTVAYDTGGSIISYAGDAAHQFSETNNLANRMVTLTKAGATTTYAYDTEGRRIRKFTSSGAGAGAASTVVFAYDQEDQLLGEYDATGKAIREYVWFDNTPVAVFTPDPANAANPPLVYYIQVDHLNTPRVVFDKANKVRWQWLAEPFGTTAPETNPSGSGVFALPLRFPGQYADSESGLFYNWNRYLDPATGRYVQSDPIGLNGGINTYTYGENNPLTYVDPYGLWALGDPLPQGLVDFSAGMGDVILFGQGQRLRDLADVDGGIDKCSTAYSTGEWAGVGVSVATGVAGGIRAAGARGAGKEFSHWIPNRMGGPRSIMNGNYVSSETHALSDSFRYRFMPRDWKAANPMPNRASQQWVRFPNVYKGAGAGVAYGAGGAAVNDCTCVR